MPFLSNKYARAFTLVVLLQAGAYYAVAFRSELTPAIGPLAGFPAAFGNWRMTQDAPVEKEVQDVLKADDIINRQYTSPQGLVVFFVAFFKTQRYGQAPHSPKNCLPGSGFEAVEDSRIAINMPQWDTPIVVNKYVTARGLEKSVTLYWYQSHHRVIASEYWAKIWLVADAIRYRRSDTSLVKIVVPVQDNNVEAAANIGVQFARDMFPSLLEHLPQ